MRFTTVLSAICLCVASLVMLSGCPCAQRDATIDGIAFVWCPPGAFMMGAYSGESGSYGGETPQHAVTFANGFWISKYEITQRQWWAVTGDRPSAYQGAGYGKTGNRPVDRVSWFDAQEFLSTLNALRPGKNFRLPTEAEWEYACRAGTETRFYWGDDPNLAESDDYAWYNGPGDEGTHNVGQKLPNAWGLYDMSGNAWEWVQDCAHDDYTGAPADGSAWETGDCTNRGVRGGSWYNDIGFRSAFRGFIGPDGRYADYGIRLVMVPDES